MTTNTKIAKGLITEDDEKTELLPGDRMIFHVQDGTVSFGREDTGGILFSTGVVDDKRILGKVITENEAACRNVALFLGHVFGFRIRQGKCNERVRVYEFW